jgi:phytoene dehydrogenase-like protein
MTRDRHVIIIGGGLAGLSAGSYLRSSGYRTTIVEHGLSLGGVCNAWQRCGYTIDGCIQWLTGGAFASIYEELGIVPRIGLRVIDQFVAYRDLQTQTDLAVSSNLEATARTLTEVSPADRAEIERLMEGARLFASMRPPIDPPIELSSLRDHLGRLWDLRQDMGTLVHFRKPVSLWAEQQLESPLLRRLFCRLFPEETPALFLLMILGYLNKGYLSRPEGGSARFRDALVSSYEQRGGAVLLNSTVDEILVSDNTARGVRLADGEILEADLVISTASAPETVLRLLQGRYGADELRARMASWKLFDPIVLLSYGVALPLHGTPHNWIVDHIAPFDVGGRSTDHLLIVTHNEDPALAPPGHAVVQLMLPTDYGWWATRGAGYNGEKDALAQRALVLLDEYLPGVRAKREVSDVATPLTFWRSARSWRGAYEGWRPSSASFFGHVQKTLPGLGNFYMAGQWVEPGGGVPTALMSGRQAAQLVCAHEQRPFRVR